jgi:chromosome segregation ATPase
MIASQKAHINELVQKTRNLDDTIERLQDQLSNSRDEWQSERKEWADGCDTLLACHRIAHLRTNVLLAQERVALEHERDLTRRERVAVIQRDYNLILFKAREKELELEADKLKEELRGAADGNVALVAELREKLAEGMRELKEKAALLRDAEKARDDAEVCRPTLSSIAYIHDCSSSSFIFSRNRPPKFAPNTRPCKLSSHRLAQTWRGSPCASRTLRRVLPIRID